MAITVVSLASQGDTTDAATSGLVLSRAPNPNTLVLVGVVASDTAGTASDGPTGVVGANMTFSNITTLIAFNTAGSPSHTLTVWRAMSGTPDNSNVTVTHADAGTGVGAIVLEVSGVSTAGLNGDLAVGGSATTQSASQNTLTAFGPSAGSTANAWVSFWAKASASLTTGVSRNWTSIDSVAYATPNTGLHSAWTTLASATSVEWTCATANAAQQAAVTIELVADNPALVSSSSGGGFCSTLQAHINRSYPPRIRGDILVLPGDIRSTDPAVDTWEGQAT